MKKVLALLLAILLMLPLSALPTFVASADVEGRILKEVSLKESLSSRKIGSDQKISDKFTGFSQVDLSAYSTSDLALEMDLYLEGNLTSFKNGLKAYVELNSAGQKGKNALRFDLAKVEWQTDKWFRVTIKFADATAYGGAIDLTNIKFVHTSIYSSGAVDNTYSFKYYNIRIVDTSKGAVGTDLIGDGTFKVLDPDWQLIETTYPTTEAVIAGYNFGDYFAPGSDVDATKGLQSLLNAIYDAGGGTVYIPAGTYTFKGTLTIPEGVTIQGDWRAPTEENPEATGTIFKVYSGKGNDKGSAFITMWPNACVQGITFWYPEQDAENITPYPVTVQMFDESKWGKDYTHVRNCTFINSYRAVQQGPGGSGCPNVYNVYGTPLYLGLFMDNIADIGRFDYVYFSPSYWEECGLPGAPTSDTAKAALREHLKANAIGMQVGRVDWSYWAFSEITGYQTGLYFAESPADPGAYSNGHVYGMTFTDCEIGIGINGISSAGELFSNITIQNCTTGIKTNRSAQADLGNLQMNYITIDADTAIDHGGNMRLFLNAATIERGDVVLSGGPITISGSNFETETPHVTAKNGASSVILMGNTATTGEFTVDNQSMCPMETSDEPVEMDEIDLMTGDQSADDTVKAAREVLYVADLDKTGTKDVTPALQTLLNKAGEEGGGYVFLPGGNYRLDGSVTVPSGVELVGAVDIGRNCYQIGTIFRVYGTQEDATVILSANSGLRGIVFDYPEQGNTVTTLKQNYPYAVQGRGENVYIVNVTIRNGFDGVDLMTYRCDNHYIKYLAGFCFHSVIKVGGGAVGGKIINYQMNSSAWWNGNESKYGGWTNCPTDAEKGDEKKDADGNVITPANTKAGAYQLRHVYVQSNCAILTVGDVTDQVLYNNFSYLGAIGVHFVEEDGKGANGWYVGNAFDYSTVGIQVEGIGDMDIINPQIVSYNHDGIEKTRHHIYLTDQCDDEVTVINLACWATPNTFLRVDGGELNIYCADFTATTESNSFAQLSGDGRINLQNGAITNTNVTTLADGALANLSVNGYINERTMNNEDACDWGVNMVRVARWDVPENATIDTTQKMFFTEAFTDTPTETSNGVENALQKSGAFSSLSQMNENSNVTLVSEDGNDMMQLYHNSNASSAYARNIALSMPSGYENCSYLLETRLNVKSLCTNGSMILALYNVMGKSASSPTRAVTFQADGVYVNEEKLADYTMDTWVRVQVALDLTDTSNKTYTVKLLDDEYNEIAVSEAIAFGDAYQNNKNAVGVLDFTVSASGAAETDETLVLVDYAFVTQDPTEVVMVTLGDVNGDGEINTTDARLTLQYAVNKIGADALDLAAADVNGDGVVNTTDARMILQYAVGKIQSFS